MTALADAVSISLALAFLFAGVAPATAKPCVAAEAEDLSTVWVGETIGEYFRLELGPDGTGLLTAQWAIGKPARAYRVVGKTLSDRRSIFAWSRWMIRANLSTCVVMPVAACLICRWDRIRPNGGSTLRFSRTPCCCGVWGLLISALNNMPLSAAVKRLTATQ